MLKCNICGEKNKQLNFINLTHANLEYETICIKCYNSQIAEIIDIELDHIEETTFDIIDAYGNLRKFDIRQLIVPTGISLAACETKDDAENYFYSINVLGDIECNQKELYEKLITKVKKEMSRKQLDPKSGYKDLISDSAIGEFLWDEDSEDNVTKVRIDGKELSWIEFGRIFNKYEGFRFKIEVFDKTEDID